MNKKGYSLMRLPSFLLNKTVCYNVESTKRSGENCW